MLLCVFHSFNISKHISISELFFMISISGFVFFLLDIFENNCPGGGALARFSDFSAPVVGVSHFLCAPGGHPFKKFPGGLPRGVVTLGID